MYFTLYFPGDILKAREKQEKIIEKNVVFSVSLPMRKLPLFPKAQMGRKGPRLLPRKEKRI